MTPIRAVFLFAAFVFVCGNASATDDSQNEAETLLDRARRLSDIRSPEAPAFRLSLTFSFTGKDLETAHGTYAEVWISGSEWRRETVVGNSRRIEIGGPAKHWLWDSGDDFPDQAAGVSALVEPLPTRLAKLEFESIKESDPATRCALTKPIGDLKQRYAFCFDNTDGFLVARVNPQVIGPRVADYSCNYSQFLKFGRYRFPREMVCFLDGHRRMEASVVDLSLAPSADAAMFAPPTGAVEMGNCSNNPVPPKPVTILRPRSPLGMRDRRSSVLLWMVIDAKGKPQNLKVSRSGGKQFDESALFTVGGWRFKPATCNGEPMAVPITVEIKSWAYR